MAHPNHAIRPQYWLTIASQRAAGGEHHGPWNSGATHPPHPGWYERHFTDGTFTHYWDGTSWWQEKYDPTVALHRPVRPHWRQVGDYPCWREILTPSPSAEKNDEA